VNDTDSTAKPYELTFEERDGYLYAFVAGEHDNYAISHAYWSEIAVRVAELGSKKVLVVEDIPEQAEMVDVFNLVTKMPEMGLLGITIAFVDRYMSHNHLNDFAVLVATNRGLKGQAFLTEREAEKWLMAQ
jgi:hypothetical protein